MCACACVYAITVLVCIGCRCSEKINASSVAAHYCATSSTEGRRACLPRYPRVPRVGSCGMAYHLPRFQGREGMLTRRFPGSPHRSGPHSLGALLISLARVLITNPPSPPNNSIVRLPTCVQVDLST